MRKGIRQIRIFEFDAGTLVSVIEQHVESRCFQFRGERFASGGQRCILWFVTVTTNGKRTIDGAARSVLSFMLDGAVRMALQIVGHNGPMGKERMMRMPRT